MSGDDYDPIFDYNDDGKLDSFERNEQELFNYGDGSMHEPDGMRPLNDEDDEDDEDADCIDPDDIGDYRAVYDEDGDIIAPEDVDDYDVVYDRLGFPIDPEDIITYSVVYDEDADPVAPENIGDYYVVYDEFGDPIDREDIGDYGVFIFGDRIETSHATDSYPAAVPDAEASSEQTETAVSDVLSGQLADAENELKKLDAEIEALCLRLNTIEQHKGR